MPQYETTPLTPKQYDKLADWGERMALAFLVSLVIQRIVTGTPLTSMSMLGGISVTALAYGLAYYWLKRTK